MAETPRFVHESEMRLIVSCRGRKSNTSRPAFHRNLASQTHIWVSYWSMQNLYLFKFEHSGIILSRIIFLIVECFRVFNVCVKSKHRQSKFQLWLMLLAIPLSSAISSPPGGAPPPNFSSSSKGSGHYHRRDQPHGWGLKEEAESSATLRDKRVHAWIGQYLMRDSRWIFHAANIMLP